MIVVFTKLLFQVIITDLGEIGENAIIVFEENVGVGAEETVANQEYVSFSNDNDDVIQVSQELDYQGCLYSRCQF